MVPPYGDAFVAASIMLSAGTYLLDFGSNVVVLVEYSTRFIRLLRREQDGISACNAVCRHQTSELAGYFYALLAVLLCCHSLNVLLFKFKFTRRQAPVFAAYFLPLIHLYRLALLLWRTLSCKGIQDLRSPEMNGLYCILGSAMEGVPMLILQFCAYLVLTRDGVFLHSMSTTFKVSVAASLVCVAYNGGTSVQSIAKNATTLKQKLRTGIIGASMTLSAALLRCLTFTYIIVYIRRHFSQPRTQREQAKFHVSDTIPLLVIGGSIVAYSVYFWLLNSPRNLSKSLGSARRLLTALAFSYMSMYLGPLYPLLSQANDTNQLGSHIFHVKLFTVSLFHLLLDLAVLCVTSTLGALPRPYSVVSSLATVGYLVSLIAYIKFDAFCGPTMSSGVSFIPAAPQAGGGGDGDVDDHTLSEHCMLTDAQPRETNHTGGDVELLEVEAVSLQVDPSCQKSNFAGSKKTEAMRGPQGGRLLPSETHAVAQARLPEAKGPRSGLSSCLSLDDSWLHALHNTHHSEHIHNGKHFRIHFNSW